MGLHGGVGRASFVGSNQTKFSAGLSAGERAERGPGAPEEQLERRCRRKFGAAARCWPLDSEGREVAPATSKTLSRRWLQRLGEDAHTKAARLLALTLVDGRVLAAALRPRQLHSRAASKQAKSALHRRGRREQRFSSRSQPGQLTSGCIAR